MWDNPRLLNLATATTLALAGFLMVNLGVRAAVSAKAFPLRVVTITSPLENVSRDALHTALNGRELGNFFGADLRKVRDWVEEMPWVRRAAVRRVWPDRLEITIDEHRAIARWSVTEREARPEEFRLVNSHGELFNAAYRGASSLPRFSGPEGASAEVTQQYARLVPLLDSLGLQIQLIQLSARLAWQIRASDGLAIELGRDEVGSTAQSRLARFVAVYPHTVGKLSRRLNYVDLRYPQGFALRVPDVERLEQERVDQDRRIREPANERVPIAPVDRPRNVEGLRVAQGDKA